MARLKLATYNINGIRARLSALLEWLEREQPDIACLQELKAPDEAFPEADLERIGYGAIWHGQKSWNGVAILARGARPEERRRGLPRGPDDTHSRYLEASVHGLVVGALYLPNGNPWPGPKFDYKLAWFERLIRHARGLLDSGEPVVLAGDFNVVPTDDLDIYDPKSWRKDALLQPESREAWFRLLEQGWTDSLRTIVGEAKVFTFWDYFRRHWERDAGLRIDHVLLSPPLAGVLADAGVDRWVRGRPGASDHAPTWVLLDADRNGGSTSTRRSTPRARAGASGTADADRGAKRTAGVARQATSSGRAATSKTPRRAPSGPDGAAAAAATTRRTNSPKDRVNPAAKKTPSRDTGASKAPAKRAAATPSAKPGVASAAKKARDSRVAGDGHARTTGSARAAGRKTAVRTRPRSTSGARDDA